MKRIISKDDLRIKIKDGIREIADIVKRTLGPGGLPIILERVGQALNGDPLGPKITKDGVSVANECASEDSEKDLIIQSVKSICRKTNTIAGDGPQDLNSKIITPTGWVRMGDIESGMEICGTNNSTQKVLGVYPKGEKELYKVHFSGGGVVKCCPEHLWTLTDYSGIQKTLPLKELISDYKKLNDDGTFKYKYFVQTTQVELTEIKEEMPLDPYLLGVLLGDGSLSGKDRSTIEISIGKNKEHILDKLILPKGINMRATWVDVKNYYRVKLTGVTEAGNTMRRLVESIGLLGTTSKTKFIPKSYLYSSIKSRESLLQGLVDTDGHINSRGLFEYSSVSETLAKDFTHLCRSLGMQISIREKDKSNSGGYSKTNIFVVNERKGYKYGNKIINIEAINKMVEMQCIKVSNPDNLYITDDFTVTHNTTTAILLGESLLNETFKVLEADPSLNPQLVKESILESSKNIITALKDCAIEIKDKESIKQVAAISANGDEEIGEIIGNAFDHVGAEGVVTVEEGYRNNVTLDVVEGYQFNRGAESRGRFFNNKNETAFEAEDVRVLIFDGNLYNFNELAKVWETITKDSGKATPPPLLIIANEFSREVIQWLLIMRGEAGLSACAVRSPHMTHIRTGMLDDIAVLTGGKRFGNGAGNLDSFKSDDIGLVSKVFSDKQVTTLYDGQGEEEAILKRVDHLKASKEQADSPYDIQIFNDRLAALTGGIAKIGVGGATEFETKEKYDRIEDALNAARAALDEGIVPGGGIALYRIAEELEDKSLGNKIFKKVLKDPFLQILENIGIEKKEAVKIFKEVSKKDFQVFDARNKKIVNAFDAGIIDPMKVTRTALENAVSIAALLSTAGGGIIFERGKK